MLDDPPPLSLTRFLDVVVLHFVTAMPVGISRRLTLRGALLSAGDPPIGLDDARHGLASSSDGAWCLLFPYSQMPRSKEESEPAQRNMGHGRNDATKATKATLLALCVTKSTRVYVMVDDVAKHRTDSMKQALRATYIASVPGERRMAIGIHRTLRPVDCLSAGRRL